jgi:hypothetical protein
MMNEEVQIFSSPEREFIGRILTEAVDRDYFPDWEFPILVGASKEEIRDVSRRWLQGVPPNPDDLWQTKNVFVCLQGYPHSRSNQLRQFVGEDLALLDRYLQKLKTLKAPAT